MEMLKIGKVSINLDALHGLTEAQAEKRLQGLNTEIVKQILSRVRIKPIEKEVSKKGGSK
jgi:hypothetical protein